MLSLYNFPRNSHHRFHEKPDRTQTTAGGDILECASSGGKMKRKHWLDKTSSRCDLFIQRHTKSFSAKKKAETDKLGGMQAAVPTEDEKKMKIKIYVNDSIALIPLTHCWCVHCQNFLVTIRGKIMWRYVKVMDDFLMTKWKAIETKKKSYL